MEGKAVTQPNPINEQRGSVLKILDCSKRVNELP